jgi:hypothetical protein
MHATRSNSVSFTVTASGGLPLPPLPSSLPPSIPSEPPSVMIPPSLFLSSFSFSFMPLSSCLALVCGAGGDDTMSVAMQARLSSRLQMNNTSQTVTHG